MRTSFLIPVYNTDLAILRLCINSVLKAAGDEHEVVVVDDASSRAETRDFLSRCEASGFDNLTVLRNAENCGVSYSLNKAADNATGELYAPVDHDDMVITQGFQLMMRYQRYQGCHWSYSDEQQISFKGFPTNHMYKPNYSPQLLRSVMYINHLQLIPKRLFDLVGGYREGFEGSQDYDLALRLSEQTTPIHVETVAYLWRRASITHSVEHGRIVESSIKASQRSLEEHFVRLGLRATVTPHQLRPSHELPAQPTGTFISRIQPASGPKVSIIIPCKLGTVAKIKKNTIVVLEHCLQSIRRSIPESDIPTAESLDVEIILVLNHGDDSQEANRIIQKYGLQGVSICDEPGFNFSRKCNLGAAQASGEILILLNDDTDIQTSGWTSHIISLLQEEDVACVGGLLLNTDRTVQSCGDNIGRNSAVHYAPEPIASSVGDAMHRYIADHETTSVTGAFFCCKKTTFNALNGFSKEFPNSFQDVDFCLRARSQGLRCLITPHVKLLHFESVSRNPIVDKETLFAIRQIHKPLIAPLDDYALYAYEKPMASVFTLTGARHYLAVTKNYIVNLVLFLRVYMSSGPRHPPSIIKNKEWLIR